MHLKLVSLVVILATSTVSYSSQEPITRELRLPGNFQALTSDIHQKILKCLKDKDLVHTAQTCSACYTLIAPILKAHKKSIDEYNEFVIKANFAWRSMTE